MKLLLIGAGGVMGRIYLSKLLELGLKREAISLVERSEDKRARLSTDFQNATILADLNTALQSSQTFDAAVVVTNPPSHHKLILQLLQCGIKNILCEKPLTVNLEEATSIEREMGDAKVYTAFQLSFSPALQRLTTVMREQELHPAHVFIELGKDRTSDTRPAIGDLEDEAVHAIALLHTLCGVTDRVRSAEVVSELTYNPFVSADAQQIARSLDSTFPTTPNDSTTIIARLTMGRGGRLSATIFSSFLLISQLCIARGVLANRHGETVLLFELRFDTDDGDVLQLKKIRTDIPALTEVLPKEKILSSLGAFLDVVAGKPEDSRLTPFARGKRIVSFTAAARRSYEKKAPVSVRYE